MLPTLNIGPAAIPTFPLLLLVAFWAGLWFSAKRASYLGLDGDYVYNAGLYGLLAGIVGARLWFVLSHWENYAGDLGQAFSLSRSALSLPEGITIAGLMVLVYLQRQGVALGNFGDAVAPGLALAVSLGHIGAFLGGEGLGTPTNLPWAVELAGAARHPTQLYQAAATLLIMFLLYFSRRWRPWPGFQLWLFVGLYSLSRLALELLQAQPDLIGSGYLAVQVIALAALIISQAVMAYQFMGKHET